MEQIQKLRKELIASIVSVIIVAVALSSSTYAWYVTNNKVTAKTVRFQQQQMDLFYRLQHQIKVYSMVAHKNL